MLGVLWREGVIRSWWVWTFALLCFAVHETLTHVQHSHRSELVAAIAGQHATIEEAQRQQEELERQLASVDDPAWQELVLMRTLGVVPDGQVKVYFKEEPRKKIATDAHR